MNHPNRTKYLIAISAVVVLLSFVLLQRNLTLTSTLRGLVTSLARMFKVQQLFEQHSRPQVLDTSNWKTYRNEQYGFEVKYPANWMIKEDHGRAASNFSLVGPLIKGIQDRFLIQVSPTNFVDLNKAVDAYAAPMYPPLKKEPLNINGYPAMLVTTKSIVSTDQIVLYDTALYLLHGGFLFGLPGTAYSSTNRDEKVILSTFRFIEPSTQKSPPGEFCGGIAAIPCPEGYWCQLDGSYPDAGGRCVKLNR